MIQSVEWFWFICLLILTGYHMVIFRRRLAYKPTVPLEWPGVSIVIAHKNHTSFLAQNLPGIFSQDYPELEILIIDDNSTDEEKLKLNNLIENYQGIILLHSDSTGKKNALAQGVQSANHDLILCTDADCKPMSNQWIKKMVASRRTSEVSLGYSPMKRYRGWLNLFIRFETLFTAIQFISWTLSGRPYMGVGRNMLYPRSLFLRINPYKEQSHIPYGDDDLLVQQMAGYTQIRVCDDPQSFVIAEPPVSRKDWWKQKHRHLSAGHFYKKALWWQPGLFGIALIGHWGLVSCLIFFSLWWKWLPVLMIGLLIRWVNYASWTKKLGDKDTVVWFPLLEITYSAYLFMMGLYTMFNRKKGWN